MSCISAILSSSWHNNDQGCQGAAHEVRMVF